MRKFALVLGMVTEMKQTTHLELSPAMKRYLLIFAAFTALLSVKRVVTSVTTLWIYKKDILSGYLLAKAMVAGVNPYLPLNELANLWLPAHNITDLNHPTPHPFALGWLCLPLAWLSYEAAARVWLLFELCCLGVAVALFFRALELKFQWQCWALACLLALGWAPVLDDLWLGQFSLCLLALCMGAWVVLRENKDWQGGLLLGVLMTLKLVGWPIVLFLLLRRRWHSVLAAGACFAGLHLLAITVHGWALVRDYYLKVGPQLSAHYRPHDANFSAWTLGTRLFTESGLNFALTPLWHAPLLAKLINVLVPVLLLALALWLAWRLETQARSFDAAFALLLGAGCVLNPIAWTHYLMLAAPALALIIRRLHEWHWPRRLTYQTLLLVGPLAFAQLTFVAFAMQFASGVNAAGKPIVGALPGLLTLIPLAALLGLLWWLARLYAEPRPAETLGWVESAAPANAVATG